MPGAQAEIDRLIDEGLTRYGLGDLDGALTAWERAHALDPQQDRARSYIDYVRSNYELLASESTGTAEAPPFGISDEDAGYQIQVSAGELSPPGSPVAPRGAGGDGWPIEGEPEIGVRELTFELEVDEPEDAATLGVGSQAVRLSSDSISFEEATREFGGAALAARRDPPQRTEDSVSQEFRLELTPTPGFEHEGTQGGFGNQRTDVRPRELGFVQVAPPAHDDLGSAPWPEPPLVSIELSTDGDPPTIERTPSDVIDRSPEERGRQKPGTTRDLPGVTRGPGPAGEPPAGPALGRPPVIPPLPAVTRLAPVQAARPPETRDFDVPTERKSPRAPSPSVPLTPPNLRELSEPATSKFPKPTQAAGAARTPPPLVSIPLPLGPSPLVNAPTRDLGLRDLPSPRPGGGPPADEELTGPTVQLAQPEVAGLTPAAPTRDDLVLPFDPIGARSEQILSAVDEQAPPDEPLQDRTRRRITALFDRAVAWNKAGELDRAVAAIDLALSEDPNSALAQKLIHRHRETMMAVFQAFLGDLERTPVLARPLHELAAAPISPRAAFLLSRVDGLLSLDEILDVSGMPRLEAYRYLCQLFLRGILR